MGKARVADVAHRAWPDWADAFLAAYRESGMVTEACKKAGITRTHAYRTRQADEDFALAWADVEQEATDTLERVAMKRAVEGSDRLIEFLLKARKPDVYGDRTKIEHSGAIKTDLASMTDEQLAAMADGLGAKRAGAR